MVPAGPFVLLPMVMALITRCLHVNCKIESSGIQEGFAEEPGLGSPYKPSAVCVSSATSLTAYQKEADGSLHSTTASSLLPIH